MGIRWRVCALLFFATTINYMDRQIFGILGPTLQTEIGWTEGQYGLITAAFTFSYAIGLFFAGRYLDWVGVKKGFAIYVGTWSLSAMAHALASTPIGFAIARVFLGFTEAGNFPASLKATAEWFPKKERSFATGIFNSGSNVGVVAAAIVVPFLSLTYGWRLAFVIQGAIGLVWLLFWIPLYKKPHEHKGLSAEEKAHIESDKEVQLTEQPKLKSILKHRGAWAYTVAKFMTDPVWWFYLFWLPKYLSVDHGITLDTLALPLMVVYIVADLGSIGGGWVSAWFRKRGNTHAEARKLAMLTCAVCVLPTIYLPYVDSVWSAVALVSLVAAAHQGWSANLFNLPSDMFPQNSVATLVGFGGFFGCFGAMLFQAGVGYFLQFTNNNYAPVFMVCGVAYVAAWFVLRKIAGDMKPVEASEL